ncbi:hypothetical protein OC835_005197 [Tilletia horrida]|nr:hypothetical protein OC835_005197 [Tilletia horrida]
MPLSQRPISSVAGPSSSSLHLTGSTTRSSRLPFKALPGEVVLNIVKFALIPDKFDKETLHAYITRSLVLKSVSRTFYAATAMLLTHHMHAFRPLHDIALQAQNSPWNIGLFTHPALKRRFWVSQHGDDYPKFNDMSIVRKALRFTKLPTIRSLSLDLRMRQPTRGAGSHDAWWSPAAVVLTRILMGCEVLQEFNVRLPAQKDLLQIAEHIVASSPNLRRVGIDIDSAYVAHKDDRPTFDLRNIVEPGHHYRALDQLVVRGPFTIFAFAPVDDDLHDMLLSRLQHVTVLGLLGSEFVGSVPSLTWLAKVMASTPLLRACQFAFDYPQDHPDLGSCFHDGTPINLPNLADLHIEVQGSGNDLFTHLSAPNLYALKIRSTVHVNRWAKLRQDQFPNLFTVSIWAPGPSLRRLEAMGISSFRYQHTLSVAHNYHLDHYNDPSPPEYFRYLSSVLY